MHQSKHILLPRFRTLRQSLNSWRQHPSAKVVESPCSSTERIRRRTLLPGFVTRLTAETATTPTRTRLQVFLPALTAPAHSFPMDLPLPPYEAWCSTKTERRVSQLCR